MQQSGDKEYYKDKNNNWTEVTDEEKIKNKNIELKTYADYKEKTKAKDYITEQERIDNMYSIVDKKNSVIIATIGNIDDKYVNISAKQLKTDDKEYLQSENTIDFSKNKDGKYKTQNQLKKIYETIQNQYEQVKEQKENEER